MEKNLAKVTLVSLTLHGRTINLSPEEARLVRMVLSEAIDEPVSDCRKPGPILIDCDNEVWPEGWYFTYGPLRQDITLKIEVK